jgi:hypothetical protein
MGRDDYDTATLRRVFEYVSGAGIVLSGASIVVFAIAGGWGMVAVLTVTLAFFVYSIRRGVGEPAEN